MIIVFGSINLDIVTHVAHLPDAGETVKGDTYSLVPGGKGANQALAAARADSETLMVGAVGRDSFASLTLTHLKAGGVNLEHVIEADEPTGIATIAVDAKAENSIVVASGANRMAHASQLEAIKAPQGFLLTQQEVPECEFLAAHQWARACGLTTVHNAAPVLKLTREAYHNIDWLIVNEVEARHLACQSHSVATAPQDMARALTAYGAGNVILTLGAKGALSLGTAGAHSVQALPVEAQDTTAAGDTFVGVFTAALEQGHAVPDALRRAAIGGSLACTRMGAQPSIPDKSSIDAQFRAWAHL